MGVSTAPVEATVSATIDGTPTTVTEGTFSVPTTAQSIVITAEAEGYTTGTYTFTNAVTQHSEESSDWLMLTEEQLQGEYAINYELLNDHSTFVPYNYEDPIMISGTEGTNTTIVPTHFWHWEEPGFGKRYALTVGIKRHTEEGYIFYPECQLDDRVSMARTGQKTPKDSQGVPPSTITVGNDVYDIYCFVYSDTSLRFHKVELKKNNTSTSETTVVATLTVDNTTAEYDDYVPGN